LVLVPHRAALVEGFVRPLVGVLGPEPIEAHLLCLEIRARGAGGFGLEGAVHPLVASVL
jgi:hypothetical protein